MPKTVEAVTLALVAIAFRLVFLFVNRAEYTDGIMQITLFKHANPYWPPLYSALCVGLGAILEQSARVFPVIERLWTAPEIDSLILAGRLISAVIGGLAAIPIVLLAGRIGGRQAGLYAGLAFIVLPSPLRWGVRVMTDATFLTLFAASLYLLMPAPQRSEARAGRFVWGTVIAVLAALTRYQGLFLLIPIVWNLASQRWGYRRIPALLAAQVLWLAIPLWMFKGGFAHAQQVISRTGADLGLDPIQIGMAYLNLAECYFYLFPYSLTPPMFFAFLGGMFSVTAFATRQARWFLAMFVLAGILILSTQAVFGIFEFRYMLPLIAFVAPYAGIGLDRLNRALEERHNGLLLTVWVLVIAPPLLMSVAILVMQRDAFVDIKKGIEVAAANAKPETRIFTNEYYNEKFPTVKSEYWARGHEVLPDPAYHLMRNQFAPMAFAARSGRFEEDPFRDFRPGDILVIDSQYGGNEMTNVYLQNLIQRWRVSELAEFKSAIIPLMPDLMTQPPNVHGNPLAWFYRYSMQITTTYVFEIRRPVE